MATTRRKSVGGSAAKVISYAVSKADVVSAVGCTREFAAEEFAAVSWSSPGRKCAYHTIQSFSPDDEITGETANEIGVRLVKEVYPGFQAVVATHCDRGHIHNHIITNAVSLKGERMQDKLYNRYSVNHIREVSDRLCREYGLSVLPEHKIGRYPHRHVSTLESRPYITFRENVRKDFSECLKAPSYEGFIKEMEHRGYTFRKKHTEITKKDAFKSRRFYRLTQLVPFAMERLRSLFGKRRKKRASEEYIRGLVKKARSPHDIALSVMIHLRLIMCLALHERESEKDIEVRAIMKREDIQNTSHISAGPLLRELEELTETHMESLKERERLSMLSHEATAYMKNLPVAEAFVKGGQKNYERNRDALSKFEHAEKALTEVGYLTERQIKRVRNDYNKANRKCSEEENRINYLQETIEQMAAVRRYEVPQRAVIRAHPKNGMVPVSDRWMTPESPVRAGSWWFVPIEPDKTYTVTDRKGEHPIDITGKELVDYLPEKRAPEKKVASYTHDYPDSELYHTDMDD